MEIEKTVATPSDIQAKVAEQAELARTLMRGTKGMRAAGTKYLPKNAAESQEAYKIRLCRTTLFNAFAKTVGDMTGKVFDKPIVLDDNVPQQIKDFSEDIDLAGRHLTVFARDVFFDAMQAGVAYILVDMPPKVQTGTARPASIADEKKAGVRPYFVHIVAENLIGWQSKTIAGVETLTQVRIKECVTEPDGAFHEKQIEQIRVLEPGTWATWRKAQGSENKWVPHENGKTSLTEITLVAVYTNRTGFMTGSPPLENLADLNVSHWQLDSDIQNIMHVANVPILFGSGMSEDTELKVGSSEMIRSSDPASTLQYVEHSGSAIGKAMERLKELEFQMQAMGLQLLVSQPGAKTATGEIRDDSKENSPLAMIAKGLGDSIEQAFGFMAKYIGLGDDAGGEVEVNTDFGIAASAAADVPQIISARAAGLISLETAWDELLRRGFLSDSFDSDEELVRVDAEADKEIERMQAANPMDLGDE